MTTDFWASSHQSLHDINSNIGYKKNQAVDGHSSTAWFFIDNPVFISG